MKFIHLLMLIPLIAVTSCGGSAQPVETDEEPNLSQNGEYSPSPADSSLLRGPAFLDVYGITSPDEDQSKQILTLKGNLPTPCNKLRIAVNPPDADKKIFVEVYSVVKPADVCMQVLEPFEVGYTLGPYPAGTYELWVNQGFVAKFLSK